MGDVRVVLDRAAIRAYERDPGTVREVLSAGLNMARLAAAMAPRDTGAGAGSIEPELSRKDPGAADVSWDNRYPYMIFHEDGTKHVPARRFLRNAFEHYIHT